MQPSIECVVSVKRAVPSSPLQDSCVEAWSSDIQEIELNSVHALNCKYLSTASSVISRPVPKNAFPCSPVAQAQNFWHRLKVTPFPCEALRLG